MTPAPDSYTNANEVIMTYPVFKEAAKDAIIKTISDKARRSEGAKRKQAKADQKSKRKVKAKS